MGSQLRFMVAFRITCAICAIYFLAMGLALMIFPAFISRIAGPQDPVILGILRGAGGSIMPYSLLYVLVGRSPFNKQWAVIVIAMANMAAIVLDFISVFLGEYQLSYAMFDLPVELISLFLMVLFLLKFSGRNRRVRDGLILLVSMAILSSSCKKDEAKYILDDFIQSGQKQGPGIEYVDLVPDINCTITDPWENTDTTINLDLNHDGIDDFSISGTICHPSMLGGDCEDLRIIPLLDNEIAVNPVTTWLDTVPYLDTINGASSWSDDQALIYSYYWIYGESSSTKGYWKDVSTDGVYYIGYKIIKDEKTFYGWIGMKRDTTTWSFSFLMTDYAILKEYEE